MTPTAAIDDPVTTLLHESAEWRLLGRLFECPSPTWHADVAAMGGEVHGKPLRAAARLARRQATEGLYHSAFGPGGPAPPREVSYHAALELGSLLSALTADYDAFGYQPETDEAPDHVSVEVGFIAYLRLKEAYARAVGDDEAAALTRRVATRFVAEHLATLAAPLAELLERSGVGYLALASRQLVSRVGPGPSSPKRLPVVQPDAFGENEEGGFACDV